MNQLIKVNCLKKIYTSSIQASGFIDALRKLIFPKYSHHTAVEDVSFEIGEGECLGLLGPNGAGKSTLIKILCGIQHPCSGSVYLNGFVPSERKAAFLKSIGVVFGHKSSLWWDLPVRESLDIARHLYGINETVFKNNYTELVESLNIKNILDRPARTLSLGERVKSELAVNLLHSPRILLLDEPTVGLDLNSKYEIRSYLNRILKERRMSILLTSHDIQDIDECCERVVLINRGRIAYDGSIDSLKRKFEMTLSVYLLALGSGFSSQEVSFIKGKAEDFSALSFEVESPKRIKVSLSSQRQSDFISTISENVCASFQVELPKLEDVLLNKFNEWRNFNA